MYYGFQNEISNKVSTNVFLSLDFFLHAFMPDHLELLSFSCHLPQFPVVFRTSSTITITAIGWTRPPLDNDNNKHNNKKWRVRELEDRIFCPNFQPGFFAVDYLSKQKFMTKPTKNICLSVKKIWLKSSQEYPVFKPCVKLSLCGLRVY